MKDVYKRQVLLGWGASLVWELPFCLIQGAVVVPYLYICRLYTSGAMHSEVMAVGPVLLKSIYSDVMKGRRDRLNGLCEAFMAGCNVSPPAGLQFKIDSLDVYKRQGAHRPPERRTRQAGPEI